MSGNEISFIKSAIESNWVSPYGKNLDDFEKELELYLGVPDVALVNTGTAAIHLGLIGLGIKTGDEVLLPSLNFAGCVNPVLYCGATPVFIDSESQNWNIDPVILEEIIIQKINQGKKPACIIAVHLFGIPCLIEEIIAVARKYEIPVLEDSADAIGSTVKGKYCGTFSDVGVLSFNGNKIITTSSGGVLFSPHQHIIEGAKQLANQARSQKPFYQFETTGYNYMMSNIVAGIGLGQISVLEDRLSKRKKIFQQYNEELSDIQEIQFHQDLLGYSSNRWLSTAQIVPNSKEKSATSLYEFLMAQHIESRAVWKPMHQHPAFERFEFYGSGKCIQLHQNGICLPSGTGMSESDLERIISQIRIYFRG